MIRSIKLIATFICLLGPWSVAEARRLEILFLGDDGHHQPLERYLVLKQALGPQGFNLSMIEDLNEVTREKLALYDALIVYANHEKSKAPEAILPWVRDGGALVALHSACGNFHPSKDWFDLVGGRFKSHGEGEFSPRTVDSEHPITKDLPVLKSWDETYQHSDLTPDRHLLQVRDPMNKGESAPEPWTWTRTEGKGRVFYTASGHDLRCWEQEAYQILVKRAILWTIGPEKSADFAKFKLPVLETEIPQVANRTHPDLPMMELQKPLSPQDSAAHTQVPAGTKLQLFASEPMVINPIAIDWDTRGRAWVIESFGYPNKVPDEPGSGMDKIKILEDTDGDGRADKMTVFAEGLRHCTTSVFIKDGVVVTDGRDIVYLGDENGDGKSDTRQVLATGLGIGDTHASTSHFLYGLDNWIYATVGYSGLNLKLAGKEHKFTQAVFRFRPDLSELEFIQNTTNNTWGLGFTESGDVTGSTANNNPSWIVSIPASAYGGSDIQQPRTPRLDASGGKFLKMFTNTRDITQVDQIHGYTAAAGHQFYTDNVLSNTFNSNSVFICEPTGRIVATGEVRDKDSIKHTSLRGNNAYASADAWSAPVAARVGPDGALWIADWYNPIIQHNVVFRYYNPARSYDQPHSPFQSGKEKGPGKGNAYETPLRDERHGRIWRVVPANTPLRKEIAVDPSAPAKLVEQLSSPSQLIRLHAQRLLVERGKADVVPSLEKLITTEASPQGNPLPLAAIHAIWTMQGISAASGAPAYPALAGALKSSHPLIRRHAMNALGTKDPAVVESLPEFIFTTESPRELLFVLTNAALTDPTPAISSALWNLVRSEKAMDPILQEAASLALRRQGLTLFSADFTAFKPEPPVTWYDKDVIAILEGIAYGGNRQELIDFAPKAPAGLKPHVDRILSADPKIKRKPVVVPREHLPGRDAYMKACIECHQSDGTGMPGTFPPLVESEWVKGNPQTLIRILLGGVSGPIEVKGEAYNGVMPGHSHVSDEEIAHIASFVRFAFGGLRESMLQPAAVKALRPDVEKRNFTPWTVKELRELEK
jgi:putative membrane-bound dehydrogenase-like protein